MKKIPVFLVNLAGLVCLVSLFFVSCSEKNSEWNPYHDWESRNSMWFQEVADSARTAIAVAKAQYGDDWEAHCQWRMFKSLQRSADIQGPLTDSIDVICGTGSISGTEFRFCTEEICISRTGNGPVTAILINIRSTH